MSAIPHRFYFVFVDGNSEPLPFCTRKGNVGKAYKAALPSLVKSELKLAFNAKLELEEVEQEDYTEKFGATWLTPEDKKKNEDIKRLLSKPGRMGSAIMSGMLGDGFIYIVPFIVTEEGAMKDAVKYDVCPGLDFGDAMTTFTYEDALKLFLDVVNAGSWDKYTSKLQYMDNRRNRLTEILTHREQ